MPRWFNTAGPCSPAIHSMLPATEQLPNVERLVAQQGYGGMFDQRDGLDQLAIAPALSQHSAQLGGKLP